MKHTFNCTTMLGKVCLVTGATSGIGKATAHALAAQGAELILVGRNKEKTEDTLTWIRSETGNEKLHYLIAEFSELDQIRELASSYKDRFSRLDLLVNNAGAFFNSRRRTKIGVERTFLINHLAPFLLTNLLLDLLKRSTPARIVNVSSDAYKYGNINFDDLDFGRFYFGMLAYARSKLANVLFTYELARRLDGTGVTANVLHPGHVATDIWRNDFSIFGSLIQRMMMIYSIPPEEAAENILHLASSQEVAGISGRYFVNQEPIQSTPITYNCEVAQKLWAISAKLTSLH